MKMTVRDECSKVIQVEVALMTPEAAVPYVYNQNLPSSASTTTMAVVLNAYFWKKEEYLVRLRVEAGEYEPIY